jgi:hypothetical protein
LPGTRQNNRFWTGKKENTSKTPHFVCGNEGQSKLLVQFNLIGGRNDQVREEEKAKHLEGWKANGKSAWAYTKGNDVNPQTFVRWTKRQSECGRGVLK